MSAVCPFDSGRRTTYTREIAMEWKIIYRGPRSIRLPDGEGTRLETGGTATIGPRLMGKLQGAGQLRTRNSAIQLADMAHEQCVKVCPPMNGIMDEQGEQHRQGEAFMASDRWTAARWKGFVFGELAEADPDSIGSEPEPDDADTTDGDTPEEPSTEREARILDALESDNYNAMRGVVADLSDDPAVGSKNEMRERLESLLEA